MDSGQGSSRPAMAEGTSEAMQQAGLRLDIVVALIGGIISYFRLKPIVTQFLSQGFGNSSRHTVSDLYIAAFGAYAPEVLLLIGVLSGAAMCFAVARSFTHLVRRLFPEAERQVTATLPPPAFCYRLPPWPEARVPQFVLGEEHQPDGTFCSNPRWHAIPLKGLVGSVLVVGAPGSSKTKAVIEPCLDQLSCFRAEDPEQKIALFVMDRKGSLSGVVRNIAARHGRAGDVVVIKLGGPRLNLIADDLPAQVIAAGLVAAGSLRQTSASHEEPEWIKSGTFRIFWHGIGIARLANGAITLKEVSHLLSGPLRADPSPEDPNAVPPVLAEELDGLTRNFQHRLNRGAYPDPAAAEAEFEFHAQFFKRQLVRMNPRNKATLLDAALDLVEPFASPQLAGTFCPEVSECPDMRALLESGRIIVFEPDERLGRAAITIGILLKLAFQRAALGRLKQAEASGKPLTRLWAFIADEYQSFVSVGEEGDDAFVALSREALITNVFATQSLAGLQAKIGEVRLRTLLGAIRSKVFLTLTDPSDCQLASRIAGETYRQVQATSFSEANKNARLSPITDTLQGSSTTVSEQRSYSEQLRPDFLPVAFSRLNTFEAIACSFDGERQRPPLKLYLKPAFLPRELPHNQIPTKKEASS